MVQVSPAFTYEVVYRNVKAMRLTVYPPDGKVKITAPPGTAHEIIQKFVASKTGWIKKHQERFLNHSKITLSPQNHSTVYVWGAACELEIIERGGNPKIALNGASMTMYIRPGSSTANKREILDAWYRRVLKEAAPAVIKKWETQTGLEVQKFYVRKMKTYWGSCNAEKQTIRLNSELAKKSPECLEYVIIHEMIHFIEIGHNRNFYRLLNQYLPEWKTVRKKMNAGEL